MALLSVGLANAMRASVLLCEDPATCPADLELARAGLGAEVLPVDVLLELDAGGWVEGTDLDEAFDRAEADALAALDGRRWAALESAADTLVDLAARHPGTLPTARLVRAWYLQGVARLERGRDEGWAYSFRQAAALADGAEIPLPGSDARHTQAWLDEQRKLLVGGRGTLLLDDVPAGAAVYVDGRPVGRDAVSLLPGNHRVTAVLTGKLRTWKAEVPVLAGRSSRVAVHFARGDDAVWVRARLEDSFDLLTAPPEVVDLLVSWCERSGADELELVQVVDERRRADRPAVTLSLPEEGRPVAADGERVDMGDGVPATYAEEVVEVHAALATRPEDVPHLRVVYFDPRARRLRAEAAPPEVVPPEPPRVRAALDLGWLGWMDRGHATLDVGVDGRLGPVELGGRIGLLRAGTPYNLRQDWVDRQLYHLGLSAGWAPPGRFVPYVAVGPDLYVPIAVGGHVALGGRAELGGGWLLRAHVDALLTDAGPGWGVGAGLGR